MTQIELINYTYESKMTGNLFEPFSFSLIDGDACLVRTDLIDDALVFLKALATLFRPDRGTYRFNGRVLDLSSRKGLLKVKKRIGYITSHSALISNRTIRENLLLMEAYHKNALSMELNSKTQALCEMFAMQKLIDHRPSDLSPRDCHLAITIRELAKSPDVLLLEHPEDYIGLANFGILWDFMQTLVKEKLPIVFMSNSKSFVQAFANRKLVISQGKVTEAARP
jgi:polar amino acid transport system ATP-binding protein